MKCLLRPLLRIYLKTLVKLAIFIHRPVVVAVAGSMNKHIAKEAIVKELLYCKIDARAGRRGFNTDIGLPLTVLNLPSGFNSYKDWRRTVIIAPRVIFKKMERVLVLEFGISEVGDSQYLLSIVKPQIIVITEITARYIENFKNTDQIIREYECLVTNINEDGLVVANIDNLNIRKLVLSVKAPLITFGFNVKADNVIDSVGVRTTGQSVIIKTSDKSQCLNVDRFGKHHAYAAVISQIVLKYFLSNDKSVQKKTKV
ncbi:hypothetical protein ISS03_01290 [Patescibacteria group bacterium]|nr:hypothetical protein [Patescibacteria group bacterium]